MSTLYSVVVGNIGTVFEGTLLTIAEEEYEAWRALADRSYGRAAGEQVTLFADGEPIREQDRRIIYEYD